MTDEAQTPKKKRKNSKVSLIEDPYGFNTLAISEAQTKEDELELDEIREEELEAPESSNAALARLEETIRKADEEETAAAEAADADAEAPSAQEELAAQIAEDQALQAQEKAEADAAEEAEKAAPSPLVGADGEIDVNEVQSCVEALLFMSDKPMPAKRLRDLLGTEFDQEIFDRAIAQVQETYASPKHGFELVEVNGGFQFRTKAGRSALAKKLVKVQTQRLSSGAMETLALVAYKQPVMKEDIDKVRGVDSSYFIRGLLDRRLIKITGRSELPGRPMLYSTTDEFMELFGLADLAALPPLHELEKMIPASESKNPEDEDPRVREMRKLVAQMKSGSESLLTYDPKEDARILQEIRDRVGSIPTSTPYLDEQKAKEKEAKAAADRGEEPAAPEAPIGETPELPVAVAVEVTEILVQTVVEPVVEAPLPEAAVEAAATDLPETQV